MTIKRPNNRAERRRRFRTAPTDIQRRVPAWVGRRRYALGIRSWHPWARWPLHRIARASRPEVRQGLRAVLATVQDNLHRAGVRA